jgi:hypothetical protein
VTRGADDNVDASAQNDCAEGANAAPATDAEALDEFLWTTDAGKQENTEQES